MQATVVRLVRLYSHWILTTLLSSLRLPTSMGHVTAPVRKVTQDNSGMRYCAIPYLSSERIRLYSFPCVLSGEPGWSDSRIALMSVLRFFQ